MFGPVLHVIRYRRENLDRLIDDINATGYGLTFGLHTRIDETAERVASRVEVGNIYINRNIIGAIVGVQPFGGSGLSGTGPKAGGPLYLLRLLSVRPETGLAVEPLEAALAPAIKYRDWLSANGHDAEAAHVDEYINRSPLGISMELPGPVGERNVYALRRRGQVLLLPETQSGLLIQIGAALATGNPMLVKAESAIAGVLSRMPVDLATRIERVSNWMKFLQSPRYWWRARLSAFSKSIGWSPDSWGGSSPSKGRPRAGSNGGRRIIASIG